MKSIYKTKTISMIMAVMPVTLSLTACTGNNQKIVDNRISEAIQNGWTE